jgi:ribosomal protein S14
MLYLKNKNLKLRKLYLKKEIYLKNKKFVFVNLLNKESSNKKLIIYSFLRNKKYFSSLRLKARIKNRCLSSNTSRSVSRSFKLSRRSLKNLLSFGLVPGYKKAVW